MLINNQALRNLTTGILHTTINDIYQNIEYIIDSKGVMTHMLPNICKALQPFLKIKLSDPYFWNGEFDQNHTGETEITPLTETELKEFYNNYKEQI